MADINAALENNGVSIGVSYGFGADELKSANYIADNIEEVERIIINYFN